MSVLPSDYGSKPLILFAFPERSPEAIFLSSFVESCICFSTQGTVCFIEEVGFEFPGAAFVVEMALETKMKMLPSEQILIGGEDNFLCLTTHRVRSTGRSWGQAMIQQIFLEDVCFAGIQMVSMPLLLVAAGTVGLIALYSISAENMAVGIGGMVVAIVLLLAYYASRRQVLTFSSAGGRIAVQTSVMKMEQIYLCLDIVSTQKNERYIHKATTAAVAT